MTDRTQPEAGSTYIIRYALELGLLWIDGSGRDKVREALDALDALEAKLASIGAARAPALSAAPADVEDAIAWLVTWKGGEHTYVHAHASELPAVTQARVMGGTVTPCVAALAASPTTPAEQPAAPKAAPGEGNSGFDHQTASDFLSGKTVSDEAVRKFVQASRWAHDEKAALNAMLLSVRGELASRNAEIALLKRALMEAEAAPQRESQEPCGWAVYDSLGFYKLHDTEAEAKSFCDHYNKRPIDPKKPYTYRAHFTAPQPAPATQQPEGDVVAYLDVGANGYLDLGSELSEDALQQLPKGRHALVIAGTYGIDGYVAAPQPAPAPLSDDTKRLAWMADEWTPGHEKLYDKHVLETGGVGGLDDLRTFIDKQIAAQEGKA